MICGARKKENKKERTKPQTYESKKERKQTHERLFTQFGLT